MTYLGPSTADLRAVAEDVMTANRHRIDATDLMLAITEMEIRDTPAMYIRMSPRLAMSLGSAALGLWADGILQIDATMTDGEVLLFNSSAFAHRKAGVILLSC